MNARAFDPLIKLLEEKLSKCLESSESNLKNVESILNRYIFYRATTAVNCKAS